MNARSKEGPGLMFHAFTDPTPNFTAVITILVSIFSATNGKNAHLFKKTNTFHNWLLLQSK